MPFNHESELGACLERAGPFHPCALFSAGSVRVLLEDCSSHECWISDRVTVLEANHGPPRVVGVVLSGEWKEAGHKTLSEMLEAVAPSLSPKQAAALRSQLYGLVIHLQPPLYHE